MTENKTEMMHGVRTVYVISFSALCLILFTGCGSLPEKKVNGYQLKSTKLTQNRLTTEKSVIQKLYHQHGEWQGVRYRLGGQSKTGIDCSGFVQLTYQSRLGRSLPRTTREQSKLGETIRRHDLTAGDLVFFRTGPTSRHVGIYLEKSKFLHVSQSRGVTISRLDNIYWKTKFWKAVRV